MPAALSPVCCPPGSSGRGFGGQTLWSTKSPLLFDVPRGEMRKMLSLLNCHSLAVISTALPWKGGMGMDFEVKIHVLVVPCCMTNITSKPLNLADMT